MVCGLSIRYARVANSATITCYGLRAPTCCAGLGDGPTPRIATARRLRLPKPSRSAGFSRVGWMRSNPSAEASYPPRGSVTAFLRLNFTGEAAVRENRVNRRQNYSWNEPREPNLE